MQNINRYFAVSYTRAKNVAISGLLQMFFFYLEVSRQIEGNTRGCDWTTEFPEITDRYAAQALNCTYRLYTALPTARTLFSTQNIFGRNTTITLVYIISDQNNFAI